MTTWDVIKALLKNTNFYWRKFFVFFGIAAVMAGGLFLVKNQDKIEASVKFANQTQDYESGRVLLNIDVSKNGKIVVNGEDKSKYLKILPDYYEISILAIDQPQTYISSFQAIMNLPETVDESEIERIVYAVHGVSAYQTYMAGPRTIIYTADSIPPQASLTIVARLPKNILTPPISKQIIYNISRVSVKSYLYLAIAMPIIAFIILMMMVARRQQDKLFYLSRKFLSAPPNQTPPPVAGVLIDGQLGHREIASIIIDLARRGYVFINRKGQSFTFGKRKSLKLEEMQELKPYEQILLSKIFEPGDYKSTKEDVDMRVGRHIFSHKIAQVYLEIYNEAMKSGFFVKNPAIVHGRWKFTGIGLFFLSVLGFAHAAWRDPDPKFTLFFWVGAMAMSAVIIKLAGLMPVRSVTGTANLRAWMQFMRYLQMPQSIGPEADLMDKFNEYLPYSIVFGVEADWAKRFMRSNFTKPDWYESEEDVITLESFIGGLFPIIDYVATELHKSHEPTVE